MSQPQEVSQRHPRHALDAVIHAPVRFAIMATLAAADKAEFGYVRDIVEVSDAVLSKQASTLAQAGYVTVCKGYVGKWPRTWLALTERGRAAFAAHCAALRQIAAAADVTAAPTGGAPVAGRHTGVSRHP